METLTNIKSKLRIIENNHEHKYLKMKHKENYKLEAARLWENSCVLLQEIQFYLWNTN